MDILIDFISIPGKTVEFEDGRLEITDPFSISRRCVTVHDILKFQAATGYVTTAEIEGSMVFTRNELNDFFSEADRLASPAFCMSYVDATAFCEWLRMRLPTEAEWMAASIVDMRIYDFELPSDYAFLFPNRRLRHFSDDELIFAGDELTSTVVRPGWVVSRREPRLFRSSDWRESLDSNRSVCGTTESNLCTCFRVCR